MCKLAFTWYNSPSVHTLKRYIFQSPSYRTFIDSLHTKSSPLRARGFVLHITPRCTGRGQAAMSYDPAWNRHRSGGMVLVASSKPCTHSLLPGRSAVKVTATQPFQRNHCHRLEGNISLLLYLRGLPLSVRQSFLNFAFLTQRHKFLYRSVIHIPLQVETFNSLLLTSLTSSVTGYAASSHFIATSWVKASGRWWA